METDKNETPNQLHELVLDNCRKDLNLKKYQINELLDSEKIINVPTLPPTALSINQIIKDDVALMLDKITQSLDKKTVRNPEEVLKATLKGMEMIDKKAFMLDNFLEGLKKGEKPGKLIQRYQELGLAEFKEFNNNMTNGLNESPKMADFIEELKKKFLRDPKTTLIKLLKITAKNIPKFVKVKFTSRLSSGFIPMPELSWTDESDLSDLLDPIWDFINEE